MSVEFKAGFFISSISSTGSPTSDLKLHFQQEFLTSRVAVIRPLLSVVMLRSDGGTVALGISSVSWSVSGNSATYVLNYSPTGNFTITNIMLVASAITYFTSGLTYVFYGGGSYSIRIVIGASFSWTVSLITGGTTYAVSVSDAGIGNLIVRRIIGTYATAVYPYAFRPNASNTSYFSYNTVSLIYFTSVSLTTVSSTATVMGVVTDQTLFVVNYNRTLSSGQWLYFTMTLVIP